MFTDFAVEKCVDRDFVWELCKRGSVHVLISQVTVTGNSLDLSGIKIPDGCEIEWCGKSREEGDQFQITFGWPVRCR